MQNTHNSINSYLTRNKKFLKQINLVSKSNHMRIQLVSKNGQIIQTPHKISNILHYNDSLDQVKECAICMILQVQIPTALS